MPFRSSLFVYVIIVGFSIGYSIGITGGLISMPLFVEKMLVPNEYYDNAYVSNPFASSDYLYSIAFISALAVTILRFHTHTKVLLATVFWFAGADIIPFSRILLSVAIGIAIQVIAMHGLEVGCRIRVMSFLLQGISCGVVTANLLVNVLRMISRDSVRHLLALLLPMAHIICVLRSVLFGVYLFNFSEDYPQFSAWYVGAMGPAAYEDARNVFQQLEGSVGGNHFDRKYVPRLSFFACASIFQTLASVYAYVTVYTPALLKAAGLSEGARSSFSCAMYAVNAVLTCASFSSGTVVDCDSQATKLLLLSSVRGGIAMLLCQMIIALFSIILGVGGCAWSAVVIGAMGVYVAVYAWSWSPLGCLLTRRILPEEIQAMGFRVRVAINIASVFFVTRFFTMDLIEAVTFPMHLLISGSVLLTTALIYAAVLLPPPDDEKKTTATAPAC